MRVSVKCSKRGEPDSRYERPGYEGTDGYETMAALSTNAALYELEVASTSPFVESRDRATCLDAEMAKRGEL